MWPSSNVASSIAYIQLTASGFDIMLSFAFAMVVLSHSKQFPPVGGDRIQHIIGLAAEGDLGHCQCEASSLLNRRSRRHGHSVWIRNDIHQRRPRVRQRLLERRPNLRGTLHAHAEEA